MNSQRGLSNHQCNNDRGILLCPCVREVEGSQLILSSLSIRRFTCFWVASSRSEWTWEQQHLRDSNGLLNVGFETCIWLRDVLVWKNTFSVTFIAQVQKWDEIALRLKWVWRVRRWYAICYRLQSYEVGSSSTIEYDLYEEEIWWVNDINRGFSIDGLDNGRTINELHRFGQTRNMGEQTFPVHVLSKYTFDKNG